MIKFDANYNVQEYTLILSKKNHMHLGQLRNVTDLASKINLNSANEISFTVNKYDDYNSIEPLWDEITDLKFVYVKELDEYYQIEIDLNDENSTYKSVTGTSACECELSQTYIYGLEINTEADIARIDYVNPTVFYNETNPKESLLNRALYKMPHYSIKYVDESLKNIQRTFSCDGDDVYSFLVNTVAEEIGCLFVFDSTDRSISVYDLKTVCRDCGYRGDFSDVCPECESKNLKYYGEDTTIYIDTENLAENINFATDVDSIKNCFRLEAGDDNMTAAVINCNPNGSQYIYYFSEDQKHDMTPELVSKLNSYNDLLKSYDEEYSKLMDTIYDCYDKIAYYEHEMMPSQEEDPTNSKKEAAKLTVNNLSPMGLTTVTSSTSTQTVNTALKEYAKVYVKSGYYKIEINEGNFTYKGTDSDGNSYGTWTGNFKITNYSDEEDVTISDTITVKVYDLYQIFLEQKVAKKIINYDEKDGSIFDVLNIELIDDFKEALTYYCLNRLTSFYDAIQGCIDIMIEEDQANEYADLYNTLYKPYREKLDACQLEIDKRAKTIDQYQETLETSYTKQDEIHKALDFEKYLGTSLYNEFLYYRREDTYQNDNYISDGFDNDEIFKRAREFIDIAKTELVKSGEHQHSISASLLNLLAMKEFQPIVEHFKEGNFIRVGIDHKVYRLRLISYQIIFGSIQNIDVEFSDVTKIRTGVSDLQSVLNQASSMATSYKAITNQVKNSKEQTDYVKSWFKNGLDATLVNIVNNSDQQSVSIGNSGLLAKKKLDFTDNYSDEQLKLLSSGIYITDDAWYTVKTAIGRIIYKDPVFGDFKESYGINAETLVGSLIVGENLGIYNDKNTLKFDSNGLLLNTTKTQEGVYNKIFTIQRDGKDQMYIDDNGNLVMNGEINVKKGSIVGFTINDHSIYSGVKESVNNTTRGIYLGDDGQIAFGDGNNYIKYYKDDEGKYRLSISADSIYLSAGQKTIDEAIHDSSVEIMNDIKIGTRNLIVRSEETKGYIVGEDGEPLEFESHSISDFIPVYQKESYIFSKQATRYEDANFRYAYYNDEQEFIERFIDEDDEIRITIPEGVGYIRVSYPDDSCPKLGKGDIITDWSPSPEDINNSINELIQESEKTNQRITELLMDDGSFQVMINSVVEKFDGYYTKEEIMQYLRFEDGILSLGSNDSDFKTELSQSKLAFKENNTEVAWISNEQLHIKETVIEERINISPFIIEVDSNGFTIK